MRRAMFEYEFEKATLCFGGFGEAGGPLIARFADGAEVHYGESARQSDDKIWTMLDAIRENAQIPCPAEAGLKHAAVIDAIHTLCPEARLLPGVVETDERICVPGLQKKLIACYEKRALLSEVL